MRDLIREKWRREENTDIDRGRGREKGVWGVERACHIGQHRSLQSVCVT